MAKRYELPDDAWELIADLVSPEQRRGRPGSNDRLMLSGIFWILCSGAAWRDLPERFGPWSTVYQRFRGWRDEGTFDQVLERLHVRLNQEGLIDLDTWMSLLMRIIRLKEVIDSTGLARSTIYKYIAEGTFPKSVPLGGRCVGWVGSEVQDWILQN